MADFYHVRIDSIEGKCVSCTVTEIYGDDRVIEPTVSMALGFLWDTVDGTSDDDQPSLLRDELAGHKFYGDQDWTLATADRIVSCVGVVDRRGAVVGADGGWSHIPDGNETRQATFNISVAEPRLVQHLSPGMEWDNRKGNVGWAFGFDAAWRTPDVMTLAKRINDTQDFEAMPALADALQAAGCRRERILSHCRDQSAAHVRGCWVVDRVLGHEWQTCDDPEAMLRTLGGRASARKLRLLAVACCRRSEAWADLVGPRACGELYRSALLVAERFADGAATPDELEDAHSQPTEIEPLPDFGWGNPFEDVTDSDISQVELVPEHIRRAFLDLEPPVEDRPHPQPAALKVARERVAQAELFRDIFGHTYCPVVFSPEWRTSTVVALAQGMYESRDFGAMPILADALQDAGCDNTDVLDHCRGPGPHVRGCWVVDLVLGKE